jgi:repressor LexA
MGDTTDLKRREKQILEFLRKEIGEKGYPPTVREICTAVGIKSTSTAHKDIKALVDKGYLRKDPAKPRALILVPQEGGPEGGAGARGINGAARDDVIDVPIVGQIAAGRPILAEENIENTMPVPAEYVKGNTFLLKVRGESMINVGIMDGDFILVEQKATAENGDIVVAMIDGFESEATVKTFYRENDHIRLQPENDSMSPILVKDVNIQGKVRGVFRFF